MLRKIVSIVTILTLTLFIAAPAALAVSDATASEVIESGGVTKVAASSDADTIYSPHQYDYEYSALAEAAYEGYIAIYG